MFPADCRYTAEHEWARALEDRSGVARVGITDYAQQALGDIVYVQLPAVGAAVAAGQAIGEVESTKSVSDIYAPVTGTVVARNERLDGQPELVNADAYGDGWLIEIELGSPDELDGLLDAAAYESLVTGG